MRTPKQNGDHQPETMTERKEQRRGEGRRVARRPMFRAKQRTDGDRQRRRLPRLHALTIRQAAATTDKTAKTGGNCQIRDRKRTKCIRTCKNRNICLHIRTIWKGKPPGGGRISCKIRRKWTAPAPADHHRHHLTTTRTATRGEVYKPEGQSLFPLLRNSPPRSHVPHSGTPIRVSHASYRQVRGRGGGFETGSKKRNGQKAEVEK